MPYIKKVIEGEMMWLRPNKPGISEELAKKGGREFPFMHILRSEAAADLGVDIGANIGYTTIPIARRCNRVVAFEPDKRSRKILEKNVPSNVQIVSMAVSKHSARVHFTQSKKPNQSHLGGNGVRVQCTSLDEYFQILNARTAFIKMDVEGAEIDVIDGAEEFCAKLKQVKFLIEIHKNLDYTRTWNMLKRWGFSRFDRRRCRGDILYFRLCN